MTQPAPAETSRPPSPGGIVRVRQRRFLVEHVEPAGPGDDSELVSLACVDDDAQGFRLQLLWRHEPDAEVLRSEDWDRLAARGFDDADRFSAYLHALRWNCVTATDPRLFQAPFRAGIRLDAYQLEPLRKALQMPRVNLFIADDVGLGKTVEAGLIARELLLRKKVRDIVVACPPSMLLQWRDEMDARFGLGFEVLDKAYVSRVRRERGFGVNPWATHNRFLVSSRLLIDEAYSDALRDWLGEFRPGSLLILDEAHHAAPAGGQRYAVDSQITRAVRDLAPRFEHRLFLSATPHNGHSNSFSALLEILDPQRFCRGVPVNRRMLDDVMVRRLKDDLRGVTSEFPRRVVEQVDLDGLPADAPELVLSSLLDEYRQLRERRLAGESKRRQAAAGLLITGLQQRLLSSVEAFARTLRVHRRTVRREIERAAEDRAGALDLLSGGVGADDERAALPEEQLAAEEDAQFAAASAATLGPTADPASADLFARETALLDRMEEIAGAARGRPDARVAWLVRWIRGNMAPPAWNRVRILVFTEYDDTKRYLHQQLSAALADTDRAEARIAVFHGPTPPEEREEIKRAFNADPDRHPLRILIATDAAREGLNLQAHCRDLFHFDVPWNPSRMEQRNGRIDRKLQPAPEVYCRYFVYRQRPEDRILAALVRKTETIRRELGSLAQVIDGRLGDLMRTGLRRDRLDALERDIAGADLAPSRRAVVDEELEAARERREQLSAQIDRLRGQLEDSQKAVGFDRSHFRAAVSSVLRMMGAEPLKPVGTGTGPERFAFPDLDRRAGADAGWAETMDSLRPPRPKDQTLWEWRRGSPARPVVFEDTGAVGSEAVHLHLEHRVVQRLLGRLLAQGFVHYDLSRACVAQTQDAVPRVILLGRLSLYGPGAARLHEELIPVTARWTEPATRKGPLAPYAREAETRTMDLLERSLPAGADRPVGPTITRRLLDTAAADVADLLPHLEARGAEYAADAAAKLARRADAEAKAMREILEGQARRIAETIARHDRENPDQLKLDFGGLDDELRQLQANRRYWSQRLDSLRGEMESEPKRIRATYDVTARRVEPVGLVYLWPVTG